MVWCLSTFYASAHPSVAPSNPDNTVLRQQLITFLQSGAELEEISDSHPLSPLKETPAIAIASYYLIGEDRSLLRALYPRIASMVINRYEDSDSNQGGLILGSASGNPESKVYLSPYINSLGNLEIYSLYLIASKLEEHSDALEYRLWCEELSGNITTIFYNHNRDCFFPINENGKYAGNFMPQELLPLVLSDGLDESSKIRIFKNCLRGWKSSSHADPEDLFLSSPIHRWLILELLSNVDAFKASGDIDLLMSTAEKLDSETPLSSNRYWKNMMRGRIQAGKKLLASRQDIPAMRHFSRLMNEEKILTEKDMTSLSCDIDTLTASLSQQEIDLSSYSKTLIVINRLLARTSEFKSGLKKGSDLWRILNEPKWRKLSPRVRKIVARSCDISIIELMNAKVVLSEMLERGTGLRFNLHLPSKPILSGSRINFKASLESTVEKYDIKRAYLQISGVRWDSGNSNVVRIDSGGASVTFAGSFSLPPSTEPGIVELPAFMDFICGGKRIEIHQRRSVAIKEGHEVILNFPSGRKIENNLPLAIMLKYKSNSSIQGSVEGVFCDPLKCNPVLPARFLVKAGHSTTELPLTISAAEYIPPGRFPFSLRLYLSGKGIAEFEDYLVRPVKWLYLGPLPETRWILENGVEYQDDLGAGHMGSKGYTVNWQMVPLGAIGENGEVLLERLDGANLKSCCLLYTLLELPEDRKVYVKFQSGNLSSLWINGTSIVSAAPPDDNVTPVNLRKGINSVLIASGWESKPHPVLFEICDESGFPVSTLKNRLNEIITEYADMGWERATSNQDIDSSDSPREVILTLERTDCSSVNLIGSFNNWDPEATPMAEVEKGKWKASLVLSPGRYPYKFLVDKKIRIIDPTSQIKEPDGFGGTNSILLVK